MKRKIIISTCVTFLVSLYCWVVVSKADKIQVTYTDNDTCYQPWPRVYGMVMDNGVPRAGITLIVERILCGLPDWNVDEITTGENGCFATKPLKPGKAYRFKPHPKYEDNESIIFVEEYVEKIIPKQTI